MGDEHGVRRPRNVHSSYHAHVYFDERSEQDARSLCERAATQFGVSMGRMHRRPVGPHPYWSCQLSFDSTQFGALIPWLDANRGRLDILVHGVTGQHLEDHSTHAYWLGEPAKLDLSVFDSRSDRPA
jgi:aromatic ring-cleaving dioxygenase